jgi:tetratricopeptide (TPR) repeat protein
MAESDTPRARKPRVPRAPREERLPDTPDPIEIAMKAVATGADRHGAARAVLEKHAHLIDIQCRREQEELGNVRVQRITRWLILAAVAALLLGTAAMLWNASQSRALVIEPFDVPPLLEQRGITGKVVSARLLDRLSDLQRRTESSRAESSYANNWEDQIQVAVPETGISLGEMWRALRRWLGEETRIGGEVVQTPTGLSITTRAGSLTGGTVEGPEAELNRLLDQSAEAIYRATQPYRYAISLPAARDMEREQVLHSLVDHPDMLERKWAYSGLSVTYRSRGDFARAIAMAQDSIALDRDMFPAWQNLGLARQLLGHDEAAMAAFRQGASIDAPQMRGEFDTRIVDANRALTAAWIAFRHGDAQESLRQAEHNLRGTSRNFRFGGLDSALGALSLAHDYRGVARVASRADFTPEEARDYDWAGTRASWVLWRAVDLGDGALADQAIAQLMAAADRPFEQSANADFSNLEPADNARRRAVWPGVAWSLAKLGRGDEAAALAARTPTDCFNCVHARALAAAAQGNRPEAERWFREAIRQAPSIPMPHHDWGMMLLRAGELDGAAALFERAHQIGPRWAEPLKSLGDIAARRGEWAEADRTYREAAERAPQWGALHLAWAQALWRLGRYDPARDRLRAATRMGLSAHHRRRLAEMLPAAGI